MVLSGAVCGLMGLLLTAGTDHTLTTTIVGGRGFTAVMVSWLAKFNPIVMVFTSLLPSSSAEARAKFPAYSPSTIPSPTF